MLLTGHSVLYEEDTAGVARRGRDPRDIETAVTDVGDVKLWRHRRCEWRRKSHGSLLTIVYLVKTNFGVMDHAPLAGIRASLTAHQGRLP